MAGTLGLVGVIISMFLIYFPGQTGFNPLFSIAYRVNVIPLVLTTVKISGIECLFPPWSRKLPFVVRIVSRYSIRHEYFE
jgi:hypothetical protein